MAAVYGPFSANADSSVSSSKPFSPEWGGPVIQGVAIPTADLGRLNPWDANSGVYSGSLSAQGQLVATQLSPASYNFVYANGQAASPTSVTSVIPGYPEAGANYVFDDSASAVPWFSGYFGTYMKDPSLITFGSNSAMPALTGVMPAKFTDMQGSFLYYADLQINRLSGSNNWDNFYFISVLNQVLGWIGSANDFTAGLNNSQANNLSYYGATSYKDLVSGGFARYKQGLALTQAFNNVGKMVLSVPSGRFGTANAVARVMLDLGLGGVITLSSGVTLTQALSDANVSVDNIYNTNYDLVVEQILLQITDPDQLTTIQQVVESTITQMSSPMDYTSITAASKINNDSAFASFAEAGVDLKYRAPNFALTLGKDFATALNNIQTEVSANVESISTTTSLLNPDIIANLRAYLPTTVSNKPASILNVIGMASGYLTDTITKINNGFLQLYATSYGPQIRDLLTNISRYDAKVPLTAAEATTANNWVRNPPAQYTTVETNYASDGGSFSSYEKILTNVGGPDYWGTQLEASKTQLFNLLNTIVADPTVGAIVSTINDNYTYLCQQLYYEHKNFNKANIAVYNNVDANQILSFVSSVPGLIEDTLNLGTDLMLYGLTQPNTSGDIAKAVFAQSKNDTILTSIGSNPTPKV
jgi:hypothetical protein